MYNITCNIKDIKYIVNLNVIENMNLVYIDDSFLSNLSITFNIFKITPQFFSAVPKNFLSFICHCQGQIHCLDMAATHAYTYRNTHIHIQERTIQPLSWQHKTLQSIFSQE